MQRIAYRTALRNIRKVYALAEPHEIEAGVNWYNVAHGHACMLSSEYGIPLRAAAEIIAALSPNSRWERNVADAYTLCAMRSVGASPESIRVLTYPANRAKAIAIFDAARNREAYQGILSGPKVARFAANIERPHESAGVTVDFHALSIAAGKRYTMETSKGLLGAVNYRTIERAYTTVGAELGLAAHQVQAVTWIVWKRLRKV